MTSVTDYLLQLQSLTKTNLEILQAINSAFTTNQTHLAVNVNESVYAIPSFISLENKINALQENFENLVHAPASGEAYFNFDGDSRAIEVRSYTQVPHRLTLNPVSNFSYKEEDVFKDFLNPVPYVNFSLTTLPNDINKVNVKKVIPLKDELKERFISLLGGKGSAQVTYADIYKITSNFTEDEDYVEYDTIQSLPIRKTIGTGTYVIEKIISDTLDEDLDEYITLKFRNDVDGYTKSLTYQNFDDTISRNLKVGDELVTYDGSAKMVITSLQPTTNTVEVKLMHGEYLNLVESNQDTEISDYSKLRFYSPIDFDKDKYIQVPLEEDQYVFVAIAALNDRMNVQAPWGTGLLMNVDTLVDENGRKFRDYYNTNVKNIGDTLHEISSMMSNTITKYSGDEFEKFITAVPELNSNYIQVTQINKHLNNSTTIQNIRNLYSQKKRDQISLTEIQTKINEINDKLASISYDDTSNMRSSLEAQLSEYRTRKNELVTSITKTMDAISLEANNSEVPIENAKYRIRGFFEPKAFAKELGIDYNHICGIQVQYRYKNVDQEQGNAMSFGDKENGENLFIFSDWNVMNSIINPNVASFNGNYQFKAQEYNGNINEPSYNQIDIPISQGETVDIRLRVVYDYGRPFVEITSAWSEIMNIKFPQEYLKDIQILDIISENNNDIETNRFKNILEERGVPSHIDDKIVDQDLIYYHKPESIASGFYTAERRIIPLKDKLSSIDTDIQNLKDEVMGSSADHILVTASIGDVINRLYPLQDNPITLEAYNAISDGMDGVYSKDGTVVSVILNLMLTNNSEHTMKIYSVFPGSRETELKDVKHYKFEPGEYITTNGGVWIKYQEGGEGLQRCNQFITFRTKDVFDGTYYYESGKLSDTTDVFELGGAGLTMYPLIRNKNSLCLDSDAIRSFVTVAPGAQIIVPILVKYDLSSGNESYTRTMSFDIRTNLYQEPINYIFSVTAKKTTSVQDKLISTTRKNYGLKDVSTGGWVKYNSTEVR